MVLRGGGSIIYVLEGYNVFVSQQATGVSLGVNAVPTGALLNGAPNPNGGDITTGTVSFPSGGELEHCRTGLAKRRDSLRLAR